MNASKAGRLFLIFAGSLAITALLGMLALLSIGQPWLALIPAGLLAVLYGSSRKGLVLAAACCWLCYFPYEWGMKLRILCSGECNIRVDLLLIYPCLFLVSLAAIFVFLSARSISPS